MSWTKKQSDSEDTRKTRNLDWPAFKFFYSAQLSIHSIFEERKGFPGPISCHRFLEYDASGIIIGFFFSNDVLRVPASTIYTANNQY